MAVEPYFYTPHNCYKWLIGLGIGHDVAAILTSDRAMFEYFIAVIQCENTPCS